MRCNSFRQNIVGLTHYFQCLLGRQLIGLYTCALADQLKIQANLVHFFDALS